MFNVLLCKKKHQHLLQGQNHIEENKLWHSCSMLLYKVHKIYGFVMTTLTIALYIKANMVVSVCLW
jgi:hypothetical protein